MKRFAIAVVAGLASVAGAAAQTTPPSHATDGAATPAGGESLSTKLNKSDGVIKPRSDIDPGIHVGAPDPHPNSTPVVPPSATGGGTAK